MNWTISDNEGVCDRFATREEADTALQGNGYPPECMVRYSEEPSCFAQ